MGALRFIGFALIVGLVVAGLDYFQQDKRTDDTVSLSGYVETISARFDQSQKEREVKQAARERQKLWDAGAKAFLPSPPEGWAQYALIEPDAKAVSRVLSEFGPVPLISSISGPAELLQLNAAGKDGALRKLDETGTVYAKEGELIWLDITLKPQAARNTLAGLALSAQDAFLDGMKAEQGYAVIDGVAFIETTGNLLDDTKKTNHRTFTGRIGFDQEVVIRLHADASDATIREFLGLVDYAGLNALLPHPALVVGNGIEVPLIRQPEIADEMHDLYETMQIAQLRLGQEKLENLDAAALVANTLSSSGFNSEGVMDITNGEVFENQELSQLSYIRTQNLLLASALSEVETEVAGTGGIGGFIKGLMGKVAHANANADEPEPQVAPSAEVKVRKGGLGKSSCATLGSSKRCSVGGN
ncbi:hypothetical protein [Ruegeria atlantica]|uniref:Uncharacterized protein n=1 Tax=Ruegeria atlantica TaxID=81569 RepID=A0A0P1E8W1_9RHOB|nr:hypothetical protein [Ruegeria atlantica]CUH45569.1 hypothetical protein RUM4293_04486 [Ruegeria atlantica]